MDQKIRNKMSLTDDAVYIEKSKTIFDKVLVLMRELSKVVEYNIKHRSEMLLYDSHKIRNMILKDIIAIVIKIQ